MNSLKIGDRVKIISSEKEAIIKRKIEGKIYYKIDLDEQFFYWVEDSLKKKKGLLKNE